MVYQVPKPFGLLRRFLLVGAFYLGAAVLICLFLGILIYGDALFLLTGVATIGAVTLTVSGIAGGLFLLGRFLSFFETHWYRRPGHQALPAILLAAAGLVLTGCDQTTVSTKVKGAVQGTINQPSTGLKANYRNMETENIKLVMNEEVLGHTDIPLGEKFYIINEGVKGLQEKEGQVSVGCSLQITDENGTVLMNEADLFAANDVFNKDSATLLRCAVSTGLPMESENFYLVKARFWDKYGEGFIENAVRIRIIDMP